MNLRLTVICLAAASVGLSMAIISIAKLLLMICGLVILVRAIQASEVGKPLVGKVTLVAVLIALFALALSLFWTTAPQAEALTALGKYGKLLVVVLMLLLIRDRQEALYALTWFIGAQIFLVLSSWMLFVHLPVPWATSRSALTSYAVFSSYLDQGIMGAVLAAICWHLRGLAPGRFGSHLAVFAALMTLCNVFFVLSGRSGHVVAITLLSLAIMWELPKKYRGVIVLLPFLLALSLFFSSDKVRERLTMVKTEVETYSTEVQAVTSSGIRLTLWTSAIQMIAEHPFVGSGVGSWSLEYNRVQRAKNPAHSDIPANGNPHQEYLQWGMQLGIPGILLLVALMISITRDTLGMETMHARAAQSTLIALSVACLFNSSIYDALIGDFFCVALGLLMALGLRKPAEFQVGQAAPKYAA